jgi:serine/threonine protein kinase
MEYMSGGDLKELEEAEIFREKRKKITAEITLAVQFPHENCILHRDLKLENVLVDSDGHCKDGDFGLCKLGLFHQCKATTVWNAVLYGSSDSEEQALWSTRRLVDSWSKDIRDVDGTSTISLRRKRGHG